MKTYDGLLLSGAVGILVVIQIDDIHAGGDRFDRPVLFLRQKMKNVPKNSRQILRLMLKPKKDRVRGIKYWKPWRDLSESEETYMM